uniref:type II secretion system F family protein n=1 Tax=Sphingomonas sp. TaxID=28214 RepID=UPI003B3BB6FE
MGANILGVGLIDMATLLSAAAVFALLVAVHAATTIHDPMAKRVKALNERREQLKAGLTASPRRRSRLMQTNRTTDRMRGLLAGFRVLQDQQVREVQARLMQAGIRSNDAAVAVIFGRLALPIAIGGTAIVGVYLIGWFPTWGGLKRYAFVAASLVLSYKAPDLWLKTRIAKRTAAIRKALPDAIDLLVICAEAGLSLDAALNRVAEEVAVSAPELADELALTAVELNFLPER